MTVFYNVEVQDGQEVLYTLGTRKKCPVGRRTFFVLKYTVKYVN